MPGLGDIKLNKALSPLCRESQSSCILSPLSTSIYRPPSLPKSPGPLRRHREYHGPGTLLTSEFFLLPSVLHAFPPLLSTSELPSPISLFQIWQSPLAFPPQFLTHSWIPSGHGMPSQFLSQSFSGQSHHHPSQPQGCWFPLNHAIAIISISWLLADPMASLTGYLIV